jgi:BirA family biotin operon repressor/biotin-[acetyl-CoA-carboxylase] ligase
MFEATRLALDACPHFTVVGADSQSAGHGRFSRPWHSAPNSGLYFSLVLRLHLAPADLPVVTLALGVAVKEAIQDTTQVACDLRWPNDVLIADRKCTGILTELHSDAVVAGIGINVNQSEFPPELAPIATSLCLAAGRPFDREPLLAAALDRIEDLLATLQSQGRAAILNLFTAASSYARGRRVSVELADGPVTGTTDGLDPSGFLWLRRDTGERTLILAGGVRPCC